ncbi:hypothetical protein DWU98_12940 [Dyella monticola]|uniref:Uncharacterized protein n=1 Tax=Dyella monticola TaxID=1927958 RepID=A0A370WXR3_9GAMM|nr:hypothetical protein [Dyella monticola]RDS80846.1 hypothetical protein DWU98_12940 [Dyella monticola]
MIPRRLQKESLAAERATISQLLSEARGVDDIVGVMQFESRLAEIERELVELGSLNVTRASVAMYFGGPKVLGMQGIDADFASNVIGNFQDLVSKSFTAMEVGDMGSRGPVPHRAETNLMVTGVTRGSFGFVLEELGNQSEAFETPLTVVVDDVASLINEIASAEEEAFAERIASIDSRMISASRNLFGTLSKAEATVRIVEGDREINLGRLEVERGRERTEFLEVKEDPGIILTGLLLGLLPQHKRFEFQLSDGDVISGGVASDASRAVTEQLIGQTFNPIGKTWRAEFSSRTVSRRGMPSRTYYTLIRLLSESL